MNQFKYALVNNLYLAVVFVILTINRAVHVSMAFFILSLAFIIAIPLLQYYFLYPKFPTYNPKNHAITRVGWLITSIAIIFVIAAMFFSEQSLLWFWPPILIVCLIRDYLAPLKTNH